MYPMLCIDATWPLSQKTQFCVANYEQSELLGSTLGRISNSLENCLNELLPEFGPIHCCHAFLYDEPSIEDNIRQCLRSGLDRLILLPLYAHYSCFRTGTMLNVAVNMIDKKTVPVTDNGHSLPNQRTIPMSDITFECTAIDRWSAHPLLASYWYRQIRRRVENNDSILFVAPQMRGYGGKEYSREVWATCQRVVHQLDDRVAWRLAWYGGWEQWPVSTVSESIPVQLYLLRRDGKLRTLVVPVTSLFPTFDTETLLPKLFSKRGVEFVNPASNSPVLIHGLAEIVKNHLLGRPTSAQFSTRCLACFNPRCHFTRTVLAPADKLQETQEMMQSDGETLRPSDSSSLSSRVSVDTPSVPTGILFYLMNADFFKGAVSKRGHVRTLRDFDWSTKLVVDCDTSLECLQPVVQLNLHFLEDNSVKQFEFTPEEVMPIVHRLMAAETAHRWGVRLAKYGLTPAFGYNRVEYPELESTVFGKKFKNPVGLAAGFDKDGEAIEGLRRSGFGFVEIGTVTPLPQAGNPKPRLFRLIEDEAVINRYGFNSAGVGVVYARVKKAFQPNADVPLGVNLGKNKASKDGRLDYDIGVNYFGAYSDYLVVNVSSPNTPGLRSLQKKADLQNLMTTVKAAVDRITGKKPVVLLKISPDLVDSEKKDIAKVVVDKRYGIDGLIVSNTTIWRPAELKSEHRDEVGGLSGKPLRELSVQCVHDMYRLTSGKVPIIGCGGISSGADAYAAIRAGASLVQLYSALVYQGYPVIGKIKRELVELLRRDGYSNVSEAVGSDHRK
ncbi:Dihydroorotate dehydrogenase (quinone), mitochondrial [Toxocara canis]|uniref:Dihydroorotate dehydrogenase (quinone), mitochondrial n=2 Tax=Eukaryota TaxID=2759 RepID=A0A0B2VG87_TOXCA|nr:Dihydroorotate dehydrogenase (quinone), mitochondrial [Toxocara canis]